MSTFSLIVVICVQGNRNERKKRKKKERGNE